MKRRLWGLYNTQVRGRARVRASARPSVRASEDADRTYVKRDPIIIWQSVVAFAPRESGAERWQYSLAIRFERAVYTEKGEVKQPNLAVVLTEH